MPKKRKRKPSKKRARKKGIRVVKKPRGSNDLELRGNTELMFDADNIPGKELSYQINKHKGRKNGLTEPQGVVLILHMSTVDGDPKILSYVSPVTMIVNKKNTIEFIRDILDNLDFLTAGFSYESAINLLKLIHYTIRFIW